MIIVLFYILFSNYFLEIMIFLWQWRHNNKIIRVSRWCDHPNMHWGNTVWFKSIWEKRKVLRKHSLHEEISSLGFIDVVHQWKWKNNANPLMPLCREWNSIFKPKQHTIHNPRSRQKNITTQQSIMGRLFEDGYKCRQQNTSNRSLC